ncbi:hypothetical protein [Salinilacihabitans rarus]|uniref:hypothetical protein n=1 Tax=Salinilacihabitans rarus TaxID=2961596 RepID=UPI003CCD1338
MGIREVTCPICSESVPVGLPQGISQVEVSSEPDSTRPEDGGTTTRLVRCPNDHPVYFHFTREDQTARD